MVKMETPVVGASAHAPTVTVRNNILDKDGKVRKEFLEEDEVDDRE